MSTSERRVAGVPAFAVCLAMVLAPALVPTPTFAQSPQPAFCENNVFTNGNFFAMEPGRLPDKVKDEDIDAATGWKPIWKTGSLADLYSETATGIPGVIPTPANGNYAAMWITNNGTGNATYREGMFNQLDPLKSPIKANSGTYSFTFKTAPLYPVPSAGPPSVVGVYGVRPAGPNSTTPTDLNTPSNLQLFGAGTTVLLGTAQIPRDAGKTWVTRTITFDSANFGSLAEITHVMVTKADFADYPAGLSHANQGRYIAFDDFCMQLASAPPPPPPPAFSACCPPWNSAQLFSMLAQQPSGNFAAPYRAAFTPTALLHSRMNAYAAYLKTLGMGFTQAGIVFTLIDEGGGTNPTAGTQIASATMQWTGSGTPAANFFANALSANQWYRIRTSIVLSGGPSGFLPRECETSFVEFHWFVSAGRSARPETTLQFRFEDGRTVERTVER